MSKSHTDKRNMGKNHSNKTSSAKQQQTSSQNLDKELDFLLKEATTSKTIQLTYPQRLNLVLVSLFVSFLPHIFYVSPVFDMTLSQHAHQLFLVPFLNAVILHYSYVQVASKKHEKLLSKRDINAIGKKSKEEKDEITKVFRQTHINEALAYACFIVNLIYLASFLGLAFSVSKALDFTVEYNQIVSILSPSIVLAICHSLLVIA